MSDEQDNFPTDHRSPVTLHSATRDELRAVMRAKRNAVPISTRKSVAAKVAAVLLRSRLLGRDQRIAVYAAFDGEIDLNPVIGHARRSRCILYAPRIVDMRSRKMELVELPNHTRKLKPFKSNRNSLLEAANRLRRSIDPRRLDVVLVPLVAFDVHGWRLGFGAGFYDRKFHFLRHLRRRKPVMIGIAYDFQRVPPQIRESWDVLLDAVVTESGFHRCRP